MKHPLKKLAMVFGSSICIFQLATISVMAESYEEGSYLWSDFTSEETTSVEDVVTPRARGDIFNRGFVRLSNYDGQAGIYGETLCNFIVEEVGLELYLDKYDGTVFNNYKNWDTVEYNNYQAINTFNYPVEKGYYYRLRGYHYVADGGLFENGSTMTDGLPIK